MDWELNGVSGSGVMDADGNAHVFLVPIYENYNFVNFMLLPRDLNSSNGAASSLMTRKLVAKGSSNDVKVKISDIRAVSEDQAHLLFIGWEYYDRTNPNCDSAGYCRIQTVDYTGAELNDPGEDGVYLSFSGLNDTDSIDLYPVFVSARWVDFKSGLNGSGALFVGARFRESWGTPDNPVVGMEEDPEKNIFTSLPCSSRAGYQFDGWYFLADMNNTTGEITNLNPSTSDLRINYYDASGVHTVTVSNQTAIKIANSDGTINTAAAGMYWLVVDSGDQAHITTSISSNDDAHPLFEITSEGKLKLYDGLDRLSLCANWIPAESAVTVVFWTENAQTKEDVLQGLTPGYTSSAVMTIPTSDLGAQLGTLVSGSTLTLTELKNYKIDMNNDGDVLDEEDISVLNNTILDDIGAVPGRELNSIIPGDELFYELNEQLSDNSVVIKGDGSTVFNVYFSRMEFTLVFHIGRDNYVKNAGQQKEDSYPDWNGNWIEYMYDDDAVTAVLGHQGKGKPSHSGLYSMTYNGHTYDSSYVTKNANIMGDYIPKPNVDPNDQNLYTIKAKFGAYIGDRWPSHVNPNFNFTDASGAKYTLYIWTAYYNSLYAGIANKRPTTGGNNDGNNSDINGAYEYMSKELCSNRDGSGIIVNKVHHMVAYFGDKNNSNRYKRYHILVEAMPGSFDPDDPDLLNGSDYTVYPMTTWTEENTDKSKSQIIDHYFFEIGANEVISNVQPQYQLGSDLDGYDFVYSCYNGTKQYNSLTGHDEYDIYFFYTPVSNYMLTFKYENPQDVKTDTYYYGQSLANAKKESYIDPVKEGYAFLGWYTNEAGAGDPFDFAHETMPSHAIVLYPVFKKLDYIVTYDPNGAEIDHWRQTSTTKNDSTGFRADYNETISPYNDLVREHIETTSDEINTLGLDPATEVYYYMRTRYLSPEHDGKYIPSDLRDALFLTVSQIDEYWDHYQSYPEDRFTERGATKFGTNEKDAWMDAYFGDHVLENLQKYRVTSATESYSFVGWYEVVNGVLDSAPFDFNTKIDRDTELRAVWRLDGGFYLQYNPVYNYDDGTVQMTINGQMANSNSILPTDPSDITMQLYADQSRTHILQAPTDFGDDVVFRGWIIVDGNGNPLQVDTNQQPIYYQPGDSFIVDSRYAETQQQGSVIHIQAVYVLQDDFARKPDVADLILDANGGTVNSSAGTLPTLQVGTTSFYPTQNPTQIHFNDIQANQSLHLYRYATSKTYDNVTGTNFFNHSSGYLLIGFDEGTDPLYAYDASTAPNGLRSGSPYIPTFAADSLIAVDPGQVSTIYAVWEPMVYLTLENDTYEDIIVYIHCANTSAIQIVNKATGDFERTGIDTTNSTASVTIPAKTGNDKGTIKLVFPLGDGKDFTATATNTHLNKKMSVSRLDLGSNTPVAGSQNVTYNNAVSISGTLATTNQVQDPELKGVIVTYTEIPDEKVLFDVNGGTWTETDPAYVSLGENRYGINHEDVVNNGNFYEPAVPTKMKNNSTNQLIFVCWVTEDVLEKLVAYNSGTFSNQAAVLKRIDWSNNNNNNGHTIDGTLYANYLEFIKANKWDFSNYPPYNEVLYAIWSDSVTVTFNISRDNTHNHIWNGQYSTTNTPYVYYKKNDSEYTYTLAKGDVVQRPEDPNADEAWVGTEGNIYFISWLKNKNDTYTNTLTNPNSIGKNKMFDFSVRVDKNDTLYTSWENNPPQIFTFNVVNHVDGGSPDEEFEYLISVINDKVWGKLGSSNSGLVGDPDEKWGSLSVNLKNNEQYTVIVTAKYLDANSWNAVSVEIRVMNSQGEMVKNGFVTYAKKNSFPNYVGGYRYTLLITQEEKANYITSVSVPDQSINGVFADDSWQVEQLSRCFEFNSRWGSRLENTSVQEFYSTFIPAEPINGFVSGQNNSMQIVFNNQLKPVAPTDFRDTKSPFLWLFAAGLVLFAVAIIYDRRKDCVLE
ncbi:MAG: InlB B-repeat-containing protein [Lachnospiraceae bacterium]|nr:InlB B-repeat-containing protein [Lachnospiraceae bacterium]